VACASASPDAADSDSLPPHSPGVAELLGFGDIDGLILARSASEPQAQQPASHSNDSSKELGLVRTESEEKEQSQPKPSKFASFFGKKKKKTPAPPQAPKPAPAKPTFVDDRPRFGLSKLDQLDAVWQQGLIGCPLPALLVHLGKIADVKSVKVAEAEQRAREAQRILAELEKAEAVLIAPVVVAEKPATPVVQAPPAPVSASVVPASPVAESGFVVSDDAPVAPALDAGVVFGPGASPSAEPVNDYDEDGFSGDGSVTWAKGTGFGYSGAAGDFDIDVYTRGVKVKQQQAQFVMRLVSDRLEENVAEATPAALADSALLPCLEAYLRNDSCAEILDQHASLYSDIFSLLAHMMAMRAPDLSPLLPLLEPSVASHLRRIARTAAAIEAMDDKATPSEAADSAVDAAAAASSSSASAAAPAAKSVSTITDYVIQLSNTLDAALVLLKQQQQQTQEQQQQEQQLQQQDSSPSEASSCASDDGSASVAPAAMDQAALVTEYARVLGVRKLGEVESFSGAHKYQKANESSGSSSAPISRAFTRRLAVEYADLADSLPVHFGSSAWLRVHESAMQYAQLLISGPEGTPYSGGLFLFDVFFPPTYPAGPPQVNLCTTGRGAVRFNPNLYNCGKVCLSILGQHKHWDSQPRRVGSGWGRMRPVVRGVCIRLTVSPCPSSLLL
jgi:ubiquitin-protein ligase